MTVQQQAPGSVEQQLFDIVAAQTGADRAALRRDLPLTDLGADSLDLVGVVIEAEDAFDVAISDEQWAGLGTLGDLIDFIEKNRSVGGERAAPAPPPDGMISGMLRVVLRLGVWLLSHTFYRLQVIGRDNLPARGGALLVPNHVTNDPAGDADLPAALPAALLPGTVRLAADHPGRGREVARAAGAGVRGPFRHPPAGGLRPDRVRAGGGGQHPGLPGGSWGTMLYLFAGIIFLAHALSFGLLQTGLSAWVDWTVRGGQYALLALVFWRSRPSLLLPASTAERQLWSIWLGYIVGTGIVRVLIGVLAAWDILRPGPAAAPHWEDLVLYPVASVLAGLGFFIMGSSYWGRCYALGGLFFAASLVMPLWLDWSPLLFGLLWGVALAALGQHLRRLGAAAAAAEARSAGANFSGAPSRSGP